MTFMDSEKRPLGESENFTFDSEQVPACERFDIARGLLGKVFPGYELLPTNTAHFVVNLCAWQVGEVTLGRGTTKAVKAQFGSKVSQANQAASGIDVEGTLWIFQRGRVKVRQGTVEGIQGVGSAWFMDADAPGTGETDGTDVLAINIPSKALRRAVGQNRHFESRAFAVGNSLISLLTRYVESTTVLSNNDATLRNAVGRHVTDLVALALGPTREAAERAEKRGLKSARLDAVLRAIRANFTDPEFSVSDVAAHLKVSVRYVQDLLYESGTSFTERVLELRLQEACALLSRAHITNRKVSDIAFSCGFNNLSYFHRAFRRRFGMSPAGARSS